MLRSLAVLVTGLSLGCSSSSTGGSADCASVAPCGGNLLGSWTVDESCASSSAEIVPGGCAGETAQVTASNVSGALTFNADMTYTLTSSGSYTETLTIPLSCFPPSGATVACTGINMGGTEDAGTGGIMGSCAISNSNCVCTVPAPSTATESGTYSISGSMVTTTPTGGSGSMTDSYCVSGNTLHLSGTVSGVMGTQQVVATKQ
jgi:hypothetical protein